MCTSLSLGAPVCEIWNHELWSDAQDQHALHAIPDSIAKRLLGPHLRRSAPGLHERQGLPIDYDGTLCHTVERYVMKAEARQSLCPPQGS